jgi:hypothetical protein
MLMNNVSTYPVWHWSGQRTKVRKTFSPENCNIYLAHRAADAGGRPALFERSEFAGLAFFCFFFGAMPKKKKVIATRVTFIFIYLL